MNPTTPTLTIGQRIMGDEPAFFKIVQIICFFCVLAAGALLRFHVGPAVLQEALAAGGAAGYGVAQFAVKEANVIISQGLTPGDIFSAVKDTKTEIDAIKTEIKTPAPLPAIDTALADVINEVAPSPAPIPDVAMPVKMPVFNVVQ